MTKPKIAVFAGPYATILNSPTLVTSNKGRLPGEARVPGRYDHLVPQVLAEPAVVRIKKFSGHPLEADARFAYQDDGKDYYEVELRPEDGPYLLPYVARRDDGSLHGVPFDDTDLLDPKTGYGSRIFFYPDASRVFEEIDRGIPGRDEHGEGNSLDRRADYDFFRPLPSGGYTQLGEELGKDFFPYKPFPIAFGRPHLRDLATVANEVQATLAQEEYRGAIWLECSSTIEETLYWLSLVVDAELPIAGCASHRSHGQLSNDGDRNIVDAVDYVLSEGTVGLGVVGVQDERIFAARDFKKGDDRPGGYKATGGHGGVLGSVGPPITIWYRPNYRHTFRSEVNLRRLPESLEFQDYGDDGASARKVRIKGAEGSLRHDSLPRVTLVKFASYSDEADSSDVSSEVDIMARVSQALGEQENRRDDVPKLHGFVLEGDSPYGMGSGNQAAALQIATFSGLPVVRVGRSDPGGRVPNLPIDSSILGSNLDANKARILLIAALLKLGRLPKARDPRNPTSAEREAVLAKVARFQDLFDSH